MWALGGPQGATGSGPLLVTWNFLPTCMEPHKEEDTVVACHHTESFLIPKTHPWVGLGAREESKGAGACVAVSLSLRCCPSSLCCGPLPTGEEGGNKGSQS